MLQQAVSIQMISPVKGKWKTRKYPSALPSLLALVSIQMISPVKGKTPIPMEVEKQWASLVSIQMISPVKGKPPPQGDLK